MDSKIPRDQLRYLVDKFHVGKPDDYVRAEVRRRTTGRPGWTQARIRQAEEYAVKVHHDNQDMYRYVMTGYRTKKPRSSNPCGRRRRNPESRAGSILDYIRPGDRVTVVNRFGQQRTGRAVMRGPGGWVLNMGGPHGTPHVAGNEDIVKVVPRKR